MLLYKKHAVPHEDITGEVHSVTTDGNPGNLRSQNEGASKLRTEG